MKYIKEVDNDQFKKMEYMLNEKKHAPLYLPMEQDDCRVTKAVMDCCDIDDSIPISEYIRKEFYYDTFTAFSKGQTGIPEMMKQEVLVQLKTFDEFYCMNKTEEEFKKTSKFTAATY